MIVVAFPGQGSQTPGFLDPWIADPARRAWLEHASTVAGIDLVEHGTVSDADTIRDTAVAQPLLVAAGLLTWHALVDAVGHDAVSGVAGHSVGEIGAAAAAGILDDDSALALVAVRSRAMATAAGSAATGMSAVLGGDEAELLALLSHLGLEPANFNGGGQIVVAGDLPELTELQTAPPTGARVIPLQVAGAFHTRHMAPAVQTLRAFADTLFPSDPTLPIWTNRDGSQVKDGQAFLDLIVGQVSSPVRWDRTMETFTAAGITGLIEVAPAGALTGLARRGLKGVPTVAIKTPDDLPAAIQMLENA